MKLLLEEFDTESPVNLSLGGSEKNAKLHASKREERKQAVIRKSLLSTTTKCSVKAKEVTTEQQEKERESGILEVSSWCLCQYCFTEH